MLELRWTHLWSWGEVQRTLTRLYAGFERRVKCRSGFNKVAAFFKAAMSDPRLRMSLFSLSQSEVVTASDKLCFVVSFQNIFSYSIIYCLNILLCLHSREEFVLLSFEGLEESQSVRNVYSRRRQASNQATNVGPRSSTISGRQIPERLLRVLSFPRT